jgi:hypothetical protein
MRLGTCLEEGKGKKKGKGKGKGRRRGKEGMKKG